MKKMENYNPRLGSETTDKSVNFFQDDTVLQQHLGIATDQLRHNPSARTISPNHRKFVKAEDHKAGFNG